MECWTKGKVVIRAKWYLVVPVNLWCAWIVYPCGKKMVMIINLFTQRCQVYFVWLVSIVVKC